MQLYAWHLLMTCVLIAQLFDVVERFAGNRRCLDNLPHKPRHLDRDAEPARAPTPPNSERTAELAARVRHETQALARLGSLSSTPRTWPRSRHPRRRRGPTHRRWRDGRGAGDMASSTCRTNSATAAAMPGQRDSRLPAMLSTAIRLAQIHVATQAGSGSREAASAGKWVVRVAAHRALLSTCGRQHPRRLPSHRDRGRPHAHSSSAAGGRLNVCGDGAVGGGLRPTPAGRSDRPIDPGSHLRSRRHAHRGSRSRDNHHVATSAGTSRASRASAPNSQAIRCTWRSRRARPPGGRRRRPGRR